MDRKAQAMLEYLLLTAVVAFLVFAAFGQNGVIQKFQGKAGEYYTSGVQKMRSSSSANGGWCAWTACVSGRNGKCYQERACSCPPPRGTGTCSGGSYRTCVCP